MKLSGVPVHIVVASAVIFTDGVTVGLTVTVIALEVAVAGDAHAAVEVIMHFMTCPLVSVEVIKVGLLVPTLVVPTFH